MKPEITIIMPAIRVDNWDKVYSSIQKSTKRSFELIIISPYPLTPFLQDKVNVKYIKDYGSPMRASCIGIMLAEGKFIFPTHADDGFFIEGALDKNIDFLISQGNDIKNIIICKYSESENLSSPERYQSDDYYKLVNAYPVNKEYVSSEWLIFNTAIWYREYFDQFGGWDSTFEACPMGHADLAIRAQKDGATVRLSPYPMIQNDHNQSDHRPIEIAQILYDTPIFRERYNKPLDNLKIRLDPFNWKASDMVWNKRFKIG